MSGPEAIRAIDIDKDGSDEVVLYRCNDRDSAIWVVDPKTGGHRWRTDAPGTWFGTDGFLRAWTADTAVLFTEKLRAIDLGRLYYRLLSSRATLTCVSLRNGEILWEKPLPKDWNCPTEAAITAIDGNYLVQISHRETSDSRILMSLDEHTGEEAWRAELDGNAFFDRPVVLGNQLFLHGNLGQSVLIDASNGHCRHISCPISCLVDNDDAIFLAPSDSGRLKPYRMSLADTKNRPSDSIITSADSVMGIFPIGLYDGRLVYLRTVPDTSLHMVDLRNPQGDPSESQLRLDFESDLAFSDMYSEALLKAFQQSPIAQRYLPMVLTRDWAFQLVIIDLQIGQMHWAGKTVDAQTQPHVLSIIAYDHGTHCFVIHLDHGLVFMDTQSGAFRHAIEPREKQHHWGYVDLTTTRHVHQGVLWTLLGSAWVGIDLQSGKVVASSSPVELRDMREDAEKILGPLP